MSSANTSVEVGTSITMYKQDGTRQCEPEIKPRPLDDDSKAIADLGVQVVGAGRHVRLPIFVPALCGSPTAWANVFDISKAGLTRTQLFQLSTIGFKVWSFSTGPANVQESSSSTGGSDNPFPLDFSLAANLLGIDTHPDRIEDLVGYHIRVYKRGDIITQDYQLDRINFEIDPRNFEIARWWIG